MSAYILANDLRVKHQPICVEAKETLPFSGETRRLGSGLISLFEHRSHQLPPLRVSSVKPTHEMTVLTSSIVCLSLMYASPGGRRSSRMSRSTLLTTSLHPSSALDPQLNPHSKLTQSGSH